MILKTTKKIMTELSIIFPCYNEGSNLKQIIDEIKTIKNDNFNINLEFILVNNGSKDNTSEILFNLDKKYSIKVLDIKNNLGYGGGILEGVKSAKGKIISWTHADLQCDPNDVIKAYKKHKDKLLNQNFVVKGRRIKRKIINSAQLSALSYLDKALTSKKFKTQYKLQDGDLIIINNNILAHGRSGFKLENKKVRSFLRIWVK